MRTALFSLQQSLYQRLANDPSIKTKVKGVFDAVPKDQAYPYISLGEDTARDWSTKTDLGEEITHTLHVWSRYAGKKEAKEIISLIMESLSEPLVLTNGFFVEDFRLEMSQVIDDPDGITRHGVMRLRFKISQ
jgi:hypothetical protein